MKRYKLESLDGFKYYRSGKLGAAYQISQAITAEYAFNNELDLSQDGKTWLPAFYESEVDA
jgi:hypothetical protein